MKIRPSRPEDVDRIVAIWRGAVDATHDFLSTDDREVIDGEARAWLARASLWLAVDDSDLALGFMGLSGGHLQALFIDPEHRAKGVGSALVRFARAREPVLITEVNAQNTQAAGFYERLGFVEIERTAVDDQGRPYPLIRLRLGE